MTTSLEKYRVADGSIRDVVLRPHFMLRFSRPLSPQSVSRANFAISSGSVGSVGFQNIRVDPVDRAVVFTLDSTLLPDTDYALEIHSSTDPRAQLIAFDGAPFGSPVKIPFHTTKDASAIAPEPLDVEVNPCKAVVALDSKCSGSCCHGGLDETSSEEPPVLGLSLTTSSMIQRTAVDHAAIEVEDPASPGGVGTPVPRNFPYGMPIISSGSSAGSYLMYKILMLPPSGGPRPDKPFDPWVADVEQPGLLLAAELNARMIGAPMPHPDRGHDPTGDQACTDPKVQRYIALDWNEVQEIREWIDQGAKSCDCYPPSADKCQNDAGPDAGGDAGDAPDADAGEGGLGADAATDDADASSGG